VSNTKLASALQLLRSKCVLQPSTKYNTYEYRVYVRIFNSRNVLVKTYGAEVKPKCKTENT
jgi:hypothetical protein